MKLCLLVTVAASLLAGCPHTQARTAADARAGVELVAHGVLAADAACAEVAHAMVAAARATTADAAKRSMLSDAARLASECTALARGAQFALDINAVHRPFGDYLVVAEQAALPQKAVD